MKWILTSLGGLVLLFPLAVGAANSSLPPSTSFFRSPDASFSSGQTSRYNLERTRLRSEYELSHHVKWNGHEYTMKADDLLQDSACTTRAELKENSLLLEDTKSDSPKKAEVSKGTEVEILQTRMHWAHVRSQNREGWLPVQRLKASNQDMGVFIPLIETYLREKPSQNSKILTTLSRNQRIKATDFTKDGWIKTTFEGHTGFFDSNVVAGRADFAIWAWSSKTKTWLLVNHRDGTNLKGPKGETLNLKDVTSYSPDLKKAIVIQIDDPNLPPLRARAEIIKSEATLWGVSHLDGHGEVWWKQKSLKVDEAVVAEAEGMTTDELLKRDVFSYALTPKMEGLVSAKGIWRTSDGKHWAKVNDFGEQDLPVAIHPEGTWFVGSFRSDDHGKSFSPFIRWDSLTRTIEAALHRPPRYVKIQKIESMAASKIQILVDTGIRRLTLKSSLDSETWQAIK